MFEFINRAKLRVKHTIEMKRLQKQRDEMIKGMRQKKQFEINKTELERQVELEELKAEVRKNQSKSLPKKGQVVEKKSGFGAFQDYCTEFANKPPIIGDIKLGGVNNERRYKKGRERSGFRVI